MEQRLFCLPLFKLINTFELASLLQDSGRTVWKSISSAKGFEVLHESPDFVLNILCNVAATRSKSIAVSGGKHVPAKNNLNLHDKVPEAFSVTFQYLDVWQLDKLSFLSSKFL